MHSERRGILIIHLCVLLWGFTAILGALISLSSLPLVLWRVIISGAVLGIILMVGRLWQPLPRAVWLKLMLIGVLIGIHWVCFYAAIKLANASVGVVTISTASFFTAISEPLITRTKMVRKDLLVGLLVIPGILLVVGSVDLKMQAGFWVGIIAAALVGVFTSLTKQLLTEYPKTQVLQGSFIQMMVIVVLLLACLPVFHWLSPDALLVPESQDDWIYLLLLSVFCTVLPFTLSMYALHMITPFTSNLILNLEPVYGIILAILILHEDRELNIWFYLGVSIILAVVFGHSLAQRRKRLRAEN